MTQGVSVTPSKKFRPEIQGLRGIAVLAVLIFHVSPDLLPGGFLGVDVFLVLSGFLITSQLQAHHSSNSFTITSFYTRRFLRIYPSMLAVYLVFFPICLALYSPRTILSVTDQVLSGLLASANAYYASTVGYFTALATTQPFLHTWSLSLELQFYFVWPLAIIPALRYSPRLATVVAIVVFCTSLAAAEVAPAKATSFFHLPFRLFEFQVGAILSLFMASNDKVQVEISTSPSTKMDAVSVTALGALALSFFLVENQSHLPGLLSLIPCLATAAIIFTGDRTKAGKLCCAAPLLRLGKISYSLYLVHWPLIVIFMYALERTSPSPRQAVMLVAASVFFGTLNYYGIERNKRIKALGDASRLPQRVFLGIFLSVAVGLLAIVRYYAPDLLLGPGGGLQGLSQRLELRHPSNRSIGMHADSFSVLGNKHASRTYLIIGDSFAHVLQDFAHFVGIEHNIRFVNWAQFSCPPLFGASTKQVKDTGKLHPGFLESCDVVHDEWKRKVQSGKYDGILISSRWSIFVEGRRRGRDLDKEYLLMNSSYPRASSPLMTYGTDAPSIQQKRIFFEGALNETLEVVRGSIGRILLVGEPPDIGVPMPLCERWGRRVQHGSGASGQAGPCARGFSRSEMQKRVRYSENALRRVASYFGATVLYPRKYLCDNEKKNKKYCRIAYKDEVLYNDDNHLTPVGSLYIAKRWLEDKSTLKTRRRLFDMWEKQS